MRWYEWGPETVAVCVCGVCLCVWYDWRDWRWDNMTWRWSWWLLTRNTYSNLHWKSFISSSSKSSVPFSSHFNLQIFYHRSFDSWFVFFLVLHLRYCRVLKSHTLGYKRFNNEVESSVCFCCFVVSLCVRWKSLNSWLVRIPELPGCSI